MEEYKVKAYKFDELKQKIDDLIHSEKGLTTLDLIERTKAEPSEVLRALGELSKEQRIKKIGNALINECANK